MCPRVGPCFPRVVPSCAGGASQCHWLPAASGSRQLHQLPHSSGGNSYSLVKQRNSPGLPEELLAAGSCPGQVGTPDSCCWKWLSKKPSGCEAGGGCSGSPGNCPYPGEQGCSSGGLPRPGHASPVLKTGRVGAYHGSTLLQIPGSTVLLSFCVMQVPWTTALPSTSDLGKSHAAIPFAGVQVCNTPIPMAPQTFTFLPPAQSLKFHLQDPSAVVPPAPHPFLPHCAAIPLHGPQSVYGYHSGFPAPPSLSSALRCKGRRVRKGESQQGLQGA